MTELAGKINFLLSLEAASCRFSLKMQQDAASTMFTNTPG
jgi:hypothetical protein